MELKLNVYGENNEVVKQCKAQVIDLKFGTIRSLMKLLKVDDLDNTAELLSAVYGAWDQLTKILGQCFPDMEEEDWDNVKLGELIPIVLTILKASFSQILSIPKDNDEKNLMAE